VQHWRNDTDGSTKVPGVKSAPVPLKLACEGFWAQSRPFLRISKNSMEDKGTATYKTVLKIRVQQLIKQYGRQGYSNL
jgi:hypothetical protein